MTGRRWTRSLPKHFQKQTILSLASLTSLLKMLSDQKAGVTDRPAWNCTYAIFFNVPPYIKIDIGSPLMRTPIIIVYKNSKKMKATDITTRNDRSMKRWKSSVSRHFLVKFKSAWTEVLESRSFCIHASTAHRAHAYMLKCLLTYPQYFHHMLQIKNIYRRCIL